MCTKRDCGGICAKFQASRPVSGSRFKAGQGICTVCRVWLRRRGTHGEHGAPSGDTSADWYCNCCNHKVGRIAPTPVVSEGQQPSKGAASPSTDRIESWADGTTPGTDGDRIDPVPFSRRKIQMIKYIVGVIPWDGDELAATGSFEPELEGILPVRDIEAEFGTPAYEIIKLVYDRDPPNRLSMIMEFEATTARVGRVPSQKEMQAYSDIPASLYEKEFGSWELFLEMMDCSQWREDRSAAHNCLYAHMDPETDALLGERLAGERISTEDLKSVIVESLGESQEIRDLFGVLDRAMPHTDAAALRGTLEELYNA